MSTKKEAKRVEVRIEDLVEEIPPEIDLFGMTLCGQMGSRVEEYFKENDLPIERRLQLFLRLAIAFPTTSMLAIFEEVQKASAPEISEEQKKGFILEVAKAMLKNISQSLQGVLLDLEKGVLSQTLEKAGETVAEYKQNLKKKMN